MNHENQNGSWFSSVLGLATSVVLRFPRVTLSLAVLLAIASLVLTFAKMGLRTSRLDLLNPKSGYNQRWIEYLEEFEHSDDAIIVVQCEDRKEVEATTDQIANELKAEPDLFKLVLPKVDLSRLRAKGLYYLSDQQLAWLESRLAQWEPVLQGNWTSLQATHRIESLTHQMSDPRLRPSTERELTQYALSLQRFLRGEPDESQFWGDLQRMTGQLDQLNTHYLTTDDGRIGWILVRPVIASGSFDGGAQSIERMREIIGRVAVSQPGASIGLTGLPVLEYDEMAASQRGSARAAVISLLGVAILFVVGFGSLRHPLLTVLTLVLSLAWTMGYITLVVGHLNILSMAFGVILIGLGIDFGIHYVARYLDLRPSADSPASALIGTARSVGPGVVAGGLTTALAFFTAGLTDFTGVVELGVIAGGGILLCIVATVLVLPPLIQMSDRTRGVDQLPRPLSVGRGVNWLIASPRTVLGVSLLVSGIAVVGVLTVRYDHNLLNLQSPGLESVRWEHVLLDETEHSAWFAISICDSREQLLERKKQFESLSKTVQRTEEISALLPDIPASETQQGNRQRRIAEIGQRLAAMPRDLPTLPIERAADLDGLLANASAAADAILSEGESESARELQRALSLVRAQIQNLPASTLYSRLSDFQQASARSLQLNLAKIREMSSSEPPTGADLPEALLKRFVSPGGKHLLRVYSSANIWDMESLERFVRDVRSVDPAATGQPLQTYEASRQMVRSYVHAAIYSLIAVCIVLMLDFSQIGHVLLALLPLGIGMLLMFGLLGWLGIPLNPANMIVLPLILGIGIDDGVHVVHDYRRQRKGLNDGSQGPERGYRLDSSSYQLGSSTATAIVMTSLTTMVGFGSLMVAEHRGLQSLGRVLTIGVACCLVSSLITLPAFLKLISRKSRCQDKPINDEQSGFPA